MLLSEFPSKYRHSNSLVFAQQLSALSELLDLKKARLKPDSNAIIVLNSPRSAGASRAPSRRFSKSRDYYDTARELAAIRAGSRAEVHG